MTQHRVDDKLKGDVASGAASKDTASKDAANADDKVKEAIMRKRRQDAANSPAAKELGRYSGKESPQQGKPPLPAKAHEHHEWGRIWAKDGDYVRPIDVRIVATDGTMTEISGKEVEEGTEVVIGENVASDDNSDTNNPFAPKMFGKKR